MRDCLEEIIVGGWEDQKHTEVRLNALDFRSFRGAGAGDQLTFSTEAGPIFR